MNLVLIAEDDRILAARLSAFFRKHDDQVDVLAVENGRQAIEVLERRPVALLITDIQMPEVDGLELLAYVNEHFPVIPCIVMTAHDTPELKQRLPKDIVRFLPKPFDVHDLVRSVLEIVKRDIPRGTLQGVSVVSFLLMIAMEKKTCLFEVTLADRPPGLMYIENGELFHAICGELKGEEAALALIRRERAKIRFRDFPEKKVTRRIFTDLHTLVEKACAAAPEVSDNEWGDILAEVMG